MKKVLSLLPQFFLGRQRGLETVVEEVERCKTPSLAHTELCDLEIVS